MSDKMRTIISVGDDKAKESFYFPILDDRDPEMEEIHEFNHRHNLRSQQRAKKNDGPLFFDFSKDDDDEEDITKSLTNKLSTIAIGNKVLNKPINLDTGSEPSIVETLTRECHELRQTLDDYKKTSAQEMQQMRERIQEQMQQMKDDMAQQLLVLTAQQPVLVEEPVPRVAKKLICVSGSFNMGHRDLGAFIESKEGLEYSETVKVSCDYLIVSPPEHKSQKVDLAIEYGVPIRDANFLADLLGVDNV